MLFDPDRHEPLADDGWNAGRARAAVVAIVEDAQAALASGSAWPWHPLEDADGSDPPAKSLYLGASGVLWAMWYL